MWNICRQPQRTFSTNQPCSWASYVWVKWSDARLVINRTHLSRVNTNVYFFYFFAVVVGRILIGSLVYEVIVLVSVTVLRTGAPCQSASIGGRMQTGPVRSVGFDGLQRHLRPFRIRWSVHICLESSWLRLRRSSVGRVLRQPVRVIGLSIDDTWPVRICDIQRRHAIRLRATRLLRRRAAATSFCRRVNHHRRQRCWDTVFSVFQRFPIQFVKFRTASVLPW